jgi:hypothetical protein
MAFDCATDYDEALGEHNDVERCPHGIPLSDECLTCEDDDYLSDEDEGDAE